MKDLPPIQSKRAQFFAAVSRKNEREGKPEQAIENLGYAMAEDPANADFYLSEIERLRAEAGIIPSGNTGETGSPDVSGDPVAPVPPADLVPLEQLVALFQEFAVDTEMPDWYEGAEASARDLLQRLNNKEYDAIEEMLQMYLEIDPEGKGLSGFEAICEDTDWAVKAEESDRDKYAEDRFRVWERWADRQQITAERAQHSAEEKASDVSELQRDIPLYEKRLAVLKAYLPYLSSGSCSALPSGVKEKTLAMTPVPNSDCYSFYPNIEPRQANAVLSSLSSYVISGKRQAKDRLRKEKVLATFISAGDGLRPPLRMIFSENYLFNEVISYQLKRKLTLREKALTGNVRTWVRLDNVIDISYEKESEGKSAKASAKLLFSPDQEEASAVTIPFFEEYVNPELFAQFLRDYAVL